jgi:hypothetical protein
MGCTGRYAAAWEYAAFFCEGSIAMGDHAGGGPADAALSDPAVNFIQMGAKANVGMRLYNLTALTDGLVTVVTEHTLTAAGVTWGAGDDYRIVMIDSRQRAAIEHVLDITAGDIHVALAASGACSCTLAPWATGYLAKLNIVEAGVFHKCACGNVNLSDEQRQTYMDWLTEQMAQLRDGRLDVCSGATGAETPYISWAEQSVTEFDAALIIANAAARNRVP